MGSYWGGVHFLDPFGGLGSGSGLGLYRVGTYGIDGQENNGYCIIEGFGFRSPSSGICAIDAAKDRTKNIILHQHFV